MFKGVNGVKYLRTVGVVFSSLHFTGSNKSHSLLRIASRFLQHTITISSQGTAVDSSTWTMFPHILFLSLLLLVPEDPNFAAGASANESFITLGSSINTSSTQYWSSSSGRFAFGFYPNGEGFSIGVWLVIGVSRTIVWTANRDEPPIAGGSIIFGHGGALQWSRTPSTPGSQLNPISDSSTPAASAAMLNTGNFVLYDMNRQVIWSTFSFPTDTLLAGQNLRPGRFLLSGVSQSNHASGKYRLENQQDGNLVMYPTGTIDSGSAYWSTWTFNMGLLLTLSLDPNGTIWMFDRKNSYTKILFHANQPSNASPVMEIYYRLTFDPDGILRLYSHVFFKLGRAPTTEVEWLEPGSDRCLVKGVCGPNSFCHLTVTGETSCSCLPGFEFLSTNQSTLGCWRALPTGGCVRNSSNDETRVTTTMVEVKNTTWLENPYAVLPATTSIEACKLLCLSDCACDIAMFSDSYCSKQMLPIRYGRMPGNTTLFVKIYTYQTISGTRQRAMSIHANSALISGVSLAIFSLFVLLVASLLLICRHRRSLAHMTMTAPRQEDSRIDGNIVGLRSYSFQELDLATNGFGEELGKGAYGTVFKGVVADTNQDIAVKRLEKMAEDGQREFNREVRVIARTHHRNLLRLLGFCNEGIHHLLVYEYMPNGSLANLLFHSDASPAWSKRVAIALDVARGLQYLHSEIEGPIIHCDIKPENILIDSLGIAKIADFGLAKLLIGNQTKTFTGIRGTRGYLAPEWSKNRAITVKADVYSYGIMLLEVISCKKSMDLKRAGEEYNISEWAYECVMFGDAGKVADGVDEAELVRMVNVGIWCTQSEPVMRPAMKSVALMIEGAIEVHQPPPPASYSQSLT